MAATSKPLVRITTIAVISWFTLSSCFLPSSQRLPCRGISVHAPVVRDWDAIHVQPRHVLNDAGKGADRDENGSSLEKEDLLDKEDVTPSVTKKENQITSDSLRELAIDSFLRGEYDHPFAEDAPAPHPGLSPRETIEAVLQSLRRLNEPEPFHGAAVLLRFCAPLSRGDRWGGGSAESDPWKEVLRGAITPTMLARRIRASAFAGLLDWSKLDVTDGYSLRMDLVGVPTIAFVNAAVFFRDGTEPSIVQFTLQRIGGVWLIDTARMSKKTLFMDSDS